MIVSSSFLLDAQHLSVSGHDRRGFPGSTALRDRLQSPEPCVRSSASSTQRSHRHKRLKVAAQAAATVPQSQLPQSLRNNLVTLEADSASGKCSVYLLGVSHVSQVHVFCLLANNFVADWTYRYQSLKLINDGAPDHQQHHEGQIAAEMPFYLPHIWHPVMG